MQSPSMTRYGFLRDMLSGGFAGVVSKTVVAPLERVKLLLQTQQVNTFVSIRYKGMLDCFTRVYNEQGLSSFWRGNTANVIRYFPSQAFSFAFKDLYKGALGLDGRVWKNQEKGQSGGVWFLIWGNLAAAGAAGGTSLMLVYPLELVRTLMAADVSKRGEQRKISSTLNCLRGTYAQNGIRGLYAGLSVSLFGVVIFRGLYMGGYDIAKSLLGNDGGSYVIGESSRHNLLARLGVAQMVTTLAGTVCYPLDTIRRRIMMQTNETVTVNGGVASVVPYYRNSWHCLSRILLEEGLRGLFRGLGTNLIRGMSGTLLLVGYDELKSFSGE